MNWKAMLLVFVYVNVLTVSLAQNMCGYGIGKRCPHDMSYFDGDCYKYISNHMNLVDGSHICYGTGNHLPRVKSQVQQDFLLDLTGAYRNILLDLMQDDSDWLWIDDANYTFRNLRERQTDFGRSAWQKDCAYMTYYTREWLDIECTYNDMKSLCQIPVLASGSCPWPFTDKFQNMCYFRNTYKMNFMDQAEYCKRVNASMVIIPSTDVNEYIVSLLDSSGYDFTLIGLYKSDDAEFLWSDGTSADGFNKWAPGQPDDYKMSEDCAIIMPDGLWNDAYCGNKQTIVCQRTATCQLDSLDPTWSNISRMIAAVNEEVKIACQDGMFHPSLWTQHFYLTCKADSYMFQPCDACVAGCKLDILYGSKNLIPLEKKGMLEGDTLTLQCLSGYAVANGDNTQNISCINAILSPVDLCKASMAELVCDLDVDFCKMNIKKPAASALRGTDELTLQCVDGCNLGKGLREQTVTCDTMINIQPCDKGSCKQFGCK